jgi:uncharacterized protein YjbI with pentapeptide repeats
MKGNFCQQLHLSLICKLCLAKAFFTAVSVFLRTLCSQAQICTVQNFDIINKKVKENCVQTQTEVCQTKSLTNKSLSNKSLPNKSLSNKSLSNKSLTNKNLLGKSPSKSVVEHSSVEQNSVEQKYM